jgi:hypothetical protein
VNRKTSAAFASVTAALFLAFAGCGPDAERPEDSTQVSVAASSTDSPSERWKHVDGYTQNLVCLQALERGGPDYRGMLRELMKSGVPQPDAVAMLPHAANQCH